MASGAPAVPHGTGQGPGPGPGPGPPGPRLTGGPGAGSVGVDSSVSSSPSGNAKDRKKSAHWTDRDTEILINVLIRHRETGRTSDNGFKPEVWDEASMLLERNHQMGGFKTPDACKSRWQRLQRDYKFARELLETFPGFTWDRNEHRLSASQAAWAAADAKMPDAKKHRKIHLPCYDEIAVLCTSEGLRSRPRPSKPRMSSTSLTSDSSGGGVSLALTPTGGTNPTAVVGSHPAVPEPVHHDRGRASGGGGMLTNPNGGHGQLQPGLTLSSEANLGIWNDGDDSVENVEAQFGFGDSLHTRQQQAFSLSHPQQQQKRLSMYDPSMLSHHTQTHSPKRHRPSITAPRDPTLQSTPTPTSTHPAQQLYHVPMDTPRLVPHHTQPPQQPQPQTPHQTPSLNPLQHPPPPQRTQQQQPQQPLPPPQPPQQQQASQQQQPQQQQPQQQQQAQQQQHQAQQQQQRQQQQQQAQQQQQQQRQQTQTQQPASSIPNANARPLATPNTQVTTPLYPSHPNPTYPLRSPQFTPALADAPLPSPMYRMSDPSRLFATAGGEADQTTHNGHTISPSTHGAPLGARPPNHARTQSTSTVVPQRQMVPKLTSPQTRFRGDTRQLSHSRMSSNPNSNESDSKTHTPVTLSTGLPTPNAVGLAVTDSTASTTSSVTSLMSTGSTASTLTATGSATPTGTPAPEMLRAGWTDAQRRTEAVLLLQEHENIPDQDVLAVVAEFEQNLAAVDMYLALRTDRLRVGYIKSLIARRAS